jgi:hypothetical protein
MSGAIPATAFCARLRRFRSIRQPVPQAPEARQPLAQPVRAGLKGKRWRAPEVRHLTKNIFQVKLDSVFLQQRNKLRIKIHFLVMAGGPDNGRLIFSVTPADRTSKLLSFHDPEQHGGCPRFAVGTWVLGL